MWKVKIAHTSPERTRFCEWSIRRFTSFDIRQSRRARRTCVYVYKYKTLYSHATTPLEPEKLKSGYLVLRSVREWKRLAHQRKSTIVRHMWFKSLHTVTHRALSRSDAKNIFDSFPLHVTSMPVRVCVWHTAVNNCHYSLKKNRK